MSVTVLSYSISGSLFVILMILMTSTQINEFMVMVVLTSAFGFLFSSILFEIRDNTRK